MDEKLRLIYDKYAKTIGPDGNYVMSNRDFIEGYLGLYKKHDNMNETQSCGIANIQRPGVPLVEIKEKSLIKSDQLKDEEDLKQKNAGVQTKSPRNTSGVTSTSPPNLLDPVKLAESLKNANENGDIPMSEKTLDMFARIVDTSNSGSISYYDFKAFEHFLKQPDVLFRMAFRLYDHKNEGYVTFDKVKELSEATILNKKFGFNWDCELINNTFGPGPDHKNKISYQEFTIFLNKFNYECAKQQFFRKAAEENTNGTISGHQFKNILTNLRPQRLSPFVKENLIEFASLDGMPRISYPCFESVNSLIDNIDVVKKVFDRMSLQAGYNETANLRVCFLGFYFCLSFKS